MHLKSIRLSVLLASCAVLAAMPSVAKADVVLLNGNEAPENSIEDLTGLASTPILLTVVGVTGNTPATGAMVTPSAGGPVWTPTQPGSRQGFPSTRIPLPASLPLFATGMVGIGLLGWRRRRKSTTSVL